MAMALRPIDNALPTTTERPKKQAKVAVPIQKQSDCGVNDENKAPLSVPDATVDYISSENLKPIQDPDSKFQVGAFLSFFFFFTTIISVSPIKPICVS